ncbi:MAG: flagellar filament capping protein FliD [Pseudomonadota bacterium]
MTSYSFFNGVSPALWYSHVLFNQAFGTNFSPTEGLSSSSSGSSPGGAAGASSQVKALNTLYSKDFELLDQADDLDGSNSDSVWHQQAASSTDEGVVDISYFDSNNYLGEVPDSEFEFEVSQLAEAQTNYSAAVQPTTSPVLAMGNYEFTLTEGGSDVYNLSIYVNAGQTNQETFAEIAAAINDSGSNVTAETVSGANGAIQLKLEGLTGASNSFTLADVVGNAAAATGLNNVVHSSQNAVYTMNGADYTQSNNAVFLLGGNLQVNLTGTNPGSAATVSVGRDVEKMTAAVGDLVSSMNSLTGLLASNSFLAEGLSSEWSRLLSATAQKLQGYGLAQGANQTLSLDSSTLADALNSDFAAVRDAIGGASGLIGSLKSFSSRIVSSPGAALLASSSSNLYGRMYLRSLTSAPRFRVGSSTFWQVA